MSYVPGPTYKDWLRGWKEWARTRKRGKMAQFVVDKLEDNKQAHWVDITVGKFELTEWHQIAEEWFKEKPRNSDQVDAPCMLRKGLPRAFPGLEEVKAESVKEGTQYRSRVFQATTQLVQEVLLYVNKGGYTADLTPNNIYNPHPQVYAYATTSSAPHTLHNGGLTYNDAGAYSQAAVHHAGMSTQQLPVAMVKMEQDYMATGSPSSISSDASSPYNASYYPSHPYITPPPTATLQENHGSSLDAIAQDIASQPSPLDNHSSPFSVVESSGPYSVENRSPSYMLQIPQMDDALSTGSSVHNSPRYSPDPTAYVDGAQPPINMGQVMQDPSQMRSELLEMKPFPNKSPLEGGGTLALLFFSPLPVGNKWVSFTSHQRNEYTIVQEAYQENPMALTTMIPQHAIPETVSLQVVCNGQMIAQSEFIYYANAQYNSEMLFQYLSQNLPSYFHQAELGGGAMGGATGGGGGGGYMYSGSIPSSTFGLLLGGCRLGIEPLVYATLHLPSMEQISICQLQKASDIAEEFGHDSIVECLGQVLESCSLMSRDGGSVKSGEERPTFTDEAKQHLEQLEKGADPQAGGAMVLDRLLQIAKMERRVKHEEDCEQRVPSTPEAESSPSESEESSSDDDEEQQKRRPRRTSSSNKLQRQTKSVREEDYDLPPHPSAVGRLGRRSLEEQKDSVAPLVGKEKFVHSNTRKMLIATHSDADSAVSMSFDREEYENEIMRRSSCSFASSGLFSLNMSTEGVVNVIIDPEAGYTFANSVHYECAYLVTEDYPSGDKETVFKAGDRIVQIGDTPVRDKSIDEFGELLQQEAPNGTTIKIVPRLERSPPPSLAHTSSLQGSLDNSEKRLVRRQSEQQLVDAITMKVSNLLTMKASGTKRTVTIQRSAGGYGFKMIGGNAVGLFISEVRASTKDLSQGDQILRINGHDTRRMTHFEATDLLRSSEKVTLVVTENMARFKTIREQFEFDSFYMRSCVDHASTDPRDMKLQQGTLMRVVNTILFGGYYWLAWTVDESTGLDLELRRIPSPAGIKKQYGKDAYERIERSSPLEDTTLSRALVA